jgi:hypothetical protein
MSRRALVLGPLLLAAVLATVLGPLPGTAAAPSGPVLHYRFDSFVGTTVADSSASGLHGTLVNADPATAYVPSRSGLGRALQLVGAERQYVAVPERSPLDADRFTLAAWVRPTGVENPATLGRWEVLEKAGAYWLNLRTNGQLRAGGFFGGCVDAQYWRFVDSTRTVPVGRWTHVAATYDGARLRLFIGGRAAGSLAVTGRTCANNEPLAVGAKNAPALGILEAFWDGRLDDVRIYRRALSGAAIADLAS